MRNRVLTTLAAAAATASAVIAATGPASAAAWRVDHPPYATLSNVPYAPLAGVTATSSTNAWAVGRDDGSVLTEHWNGSSWTSVALPTGPCDVFESSCQLTDVSADSATDVIAVGNAVLNASGGWQPAALAYRWNGSAWQALPVPSSVPYMSLQKVKAFSPTNAWSFGSGVSGTSNTVLAARWDGSAWTQSSTGFTTTLNVTVNGVSASSASDIWVAGQTSTSGYHNRVTHSFLLHYDGTAWTQAAIPDTGGLKDVSALSPTNVWALATNGSVLHYDGTAWTVVTQFNGGTNIVAVSATNVWIAGIFVNSTLSLAHFNGSAWSTAVAPSGISGMTGSAALPTGQVWFSGFFWAANGATAPAVLSFS